MKNNFKKVLLTSCAACVLMTTAAYAQPTLLTDNSSNLYANGLYFGVQIGHTSLHNDNAFTQTASGALADTMLFGISHIGLAGYLGYSFNDYLGVEIDYHHLADMSETGGTMNVNNHTRVQSGDVLVKGSLPVCKYLRPFVKGGASYVYQDILNSQNNGATILYQSKANRIMPVAAAGVDIHFTKSIAIDASWTHWFGNSTIHSIDFPALGISYTVGN
ncbi:MAG: outer membrane beta-barrel protein [Gammaproteobacteria bacterium]|jgi:opacity protein-like surface antigen